MLHASVENFPRRDGLARIGHLERRPKTAADAAAVVSPSQTAGILEFLESLPIPTAGAYLAANRLDPRGRNVTARFPAELPQEFPSGLRAIDLFAPRRGHQRAAIGKPHRAGERASVSPGSGIGTCGHAAKLKPRPGHAKLHPRPDIPGGDPGHG